MNEFEVLVIDDKDTLGDTLNSLALEGWQPIGGPFVIKEFDTIDRVHVYEYHQLIGRVKPL